MVHGYGLDLPRDSRVNMAADPSVLAYMDASGCRHTLRLSSASFCCTEAETAPIATAMSTLDYYKSRSVPRNCIEIQTWTWQRRLGCRRYAGSQIPRRGQHLSYANG
jgi:hypothetical protein